MPTGQNVGYARTSTVDQDAGLEAQLRDLAKTGCEKLFSEKVSRVAKRPQLDAVISYCREGDTFTVTKIDRLARSVADLLAIIERLTVKGVRVRILSPDLDTANATGKLMLNIFAAVAQFEREIMLERQREGIAKAKKENKYKGRKPISADKRAAIIRLNGLGAKKADIAKQVSLGVATVYRELAAHRAACKEAGNEPQGPTVPLALMRATLQAPTLPRLCAPLEPLYGLR